MIITKLEIQEQRRVTRIESDFELELDGTTIEGKVLYKHDDLYNTSDVYVDFERGFFSEDEIELIEEIITDKFYREFHGRI